MQQTCKPGSFARSVRREHVHVPERFSPVTFHKSAALKTNRGGPRLNGPKADGVVRRGRRAGGWTPPGVMEHKSHDRKQPDLLSWWINNSPDGNIQRDGDVQTQAVGAGHVPDVRWILPTRNSCGI